MTTPITLSAEELAAQAIPPVAGTITGTIVDARGTIWVDATITPILVLNPTTNPVTPMWGGTPVNTNPLPVTSDSNGFFSIVLPTNATITPVGTRWKLIICPNANMQCTFLIIPVPSGTNDISSVITSAMPSPAPLITPFPIPRVYDPAQAIDSRVVNFGALVANTTTDSLEFWTGSTWQSLGTSAAIPQIIQAPDEATAVANSIANPNNFYFWV